MDVFNPSTLLSHLNRMVELAYSVRYFMVCFFRTVNLVLYRISSFFRGFLIFTVSACCQAHAVNSTPATDKFEAQRALFVEAEKLVKNAKSQKYQHLKEQLANYPLFPYLQQKELRFSPDLSKQKEIGTFLATYKATPLDSPLRKSWLRYLAKKGEPELFLQFYTSQRDVKLACKNLQFILKKPDLREDALKQVRNYWVVGKSQPKECDPVFNVWLDAGMRQPEDIWERLTLAADGGKHTLIPYLKSLLPVEEQYLADLWLKVRRSPSAVSRASKFPNRFPLKETQILTYGLSRLVWKDRDLALKSWQSLNQKFEFSAQQRQKLASKFAVALAIDNHSQAELWLERANKLDDDKELFRWHLAHVLRQQDWQHVLDIIDLAPESIASELSYQYWQARAYAEVDADELAESQFAKVAANRHYYGFLASGKLSQSPELVDKPLSFAPQELVSIANLPAAKRAYEFLMLKRYASARREWVYMQSQLDTNGKLISAVLADSWGWHDQAIFSFARAGYLDDIKRRFPMAFSEQLVQNSNRNKVDPAWAFAIARRESSFMADANSSAGARGLMQLMPGTARYLAKKKINNSSLYDPEKNSQYGTQYLRYLMDKMGNNPILATASYNAGWRRVKKWVPETGSLPMDVWIETIPYKETRNYVKAVTAYRQIYADQLGHDSGLFERLANMHIVPGSIK
jgi:soluble lytic murein transglycosylase